MAIQSVSMAVQNLLLMAHASGLGACWMCAPLFCQDTVRQALSLPDDWEAQALITIGVPADEGKPRTRESVQSKVVYLE
jgi:nitroreductase